MSPSCRVPVAEWVAAVGPVSVALMWLVNFLRDAQVDLTINILMVN